MLSGRSDDLCDISTSILLDLIDKTISILSTNKQMSLSFMIFT